MKFFLSVAVMLGLALSSSQSMAKFPDANSKLYSTVAKGCKTIDLKTWQHPSKSVFKKYKIKLQKVQLCNGNKYPVFIGESEYDLSSGPNQTYAKEFFMTLLEKNAKWSYAFVETLSQEVHFVEQKQGTVHFGFEQYE